MVARASARVVLNNRKVVAFADMVRTHSGTQRRPIKADRLLQISTVKPSRSARRAFDF